MRALELQVLNTALMSREKLFMLLNFRDDIFRHGDSKAAFKLLREMAVKHSAIDYPLFAAEVLNRAREDGRGHNIVADIAGAGVCMNFNGVLERMDDERKRQAVRKKAEEVIEAIKSGSLTYDEIIDELIQEYAGENVTDEYVEFFDYLNRSSLDEIFQQIKPVKTGLYPMDKKLRGFYAGQLVLIAARPGLGKTTLGIQIAESIGEQVFFFSLEMLRQEIYAKILSNHTSIESGRILHDDLKDDERITVAKMHDRLKSSLKITLFDGAPDLRRLVYYINHMTAMKRPAAIFIDYLQLISGAKGENQNTRVGVVSRTLKLLAVKHRVPIIAMSQMSREIERANREPQLADLRDSGCLCGNSLVFDCKQKTIKKIKVLDGERGISTMSIKDSKCEVVAMAAGRYSGEKEVYEIKTISGHSIIATGEHRFLVFDNTWKRLDQITTDELVALPLGFDCANIFDGRDLAHARFIAMMIGNGCSLPNHSYQFTANALDVDLCETIMMDSQTITGGALRPYTKKTTYKNRNTSWLNVFFPAKVLPSKSKPSPMTKYLKEMGLYNMRAKEKKIPEFVFFETVDFRKEFVRHLFSTDGTVSVSLGKKNMVNIAYSSTSKQLIDGLQLLLQSLGILSSVSEVRQNKFKWFNLSVYSLYFQKKYLEEIGFAGKRKSTKAQEALAFLSGINPGWTKYILSPNGKVVYVQVASIEKKGISDVYDLSVPHTKNFIANGFVVHNSLEQDANVVIFLHQDKDGNHYPIVAKNRMGGVGRIDGIEFDRQFSRFLDTSRDAAEWYQE